MNYPLYLAEDEIKSILHDELSQLKYKHELKLEIPSEEVGDFAFPCFQLAPILKKSPNDIAADIAKQIKKSEWIEKIESKGAYVNFFLNKKKLVSSTIKSVLEKQEIYGFLKKKNKKVIIEHTSANPNGPLHVGRARNPIIGDTVVRLFKAAGYNVKSQFYLDDMGKQVAILTWGVNNLKTTEIPKSNRNKADHKTVGFYQKAN